MTADGPFGRPDGEARQPPSTESGLGPPAEGTEAPPPSRRPRPPRPPAGLGSPTTWVTGVVVVLVLAYVTVNTFTTKHTSARGITNGQPLPAFAAPLALANAKCKGGQDCDANVQIRARNGVPKACDVRGPKIVNSCQLAERGPVALAFLVAPSQKCIDEIDTLQSLVPRYPNVQFAAVAIRGNHDKLDAIIRRHGWTLPVAYDHDGAVANAFGVAVCPTITFARKGGAVVATTLGTASPATIERDIAKAGVDDDSIGAPATP
jgi:hypothetical protein